MAGKRTRTVTCAKCGINSKDNPTLSFHRFPQPSAHDSLKAKVWAKFCIPNDDWSSDELLCKLYKQNKVLCTKHFDNSAYTSNTRIRLNKFAIPYEAQNILAKLCEEMNNTQIQMDLEIEANQFQCKSIEESNKENNLQTSELNKERRKGIIEEIGAKSLADLTPRKKKPV